MWQVSVVLLWLTLTSPSSDGLSDRRGEEMSLPCSSLRILSFFTRGFLFLTLTFRGRDWVSYYMWVVGVFVEIRTVWRSYSMINISIPLPLFWTSLYCLVLFSAAWEDTQLSPVTAWPEASCLDHLAESVQRYGNVKTSFIFWYTILRTCRLWCKYNREI